MKKILLFALCLISLCCLCHAEETEYSLPLDFSGGYKPKAENFTKNSYEDESLSVKMERRDIDGVRYDIAWIKVKSPTQLRTAVAGNANEVVAEKPGKMARRVNAVVAINGDFYTQRKDGLIYRQGQAFRYALNPEKDVLVIDDQGDLHIIKAPTKADMQAFKAQLEADGRTVVNGFTFGPGLVINGERQTGFVDMDNAALRCAQRMCLAQIGPLEYLCISSEGPEDPGSKGLNLEQFAELVSSFEGVQNAYNLDGGSSATMVFNRNKVNAPNNPKKRPLNDIIYFASAYRPD